MMSLWRDDANKNLQWRMMHLLEKTDVSRWIWIVGDTTDDTERILRDWTALMPDKDITIIRHDTHIDGEAPKTRLLRLSETANAGLDAITQTDDYVVIHESDLISPVDIVCQFLTSGKEVIAGWPMLGGIFYDVWAYRKDGQMFRNTPPYHACYRTDELFEVDSVGSVWMFPARDIVAGVRMADRGCLDICGALRSSGKTIWVDPRIIIEQPRELWTSRAHA